jgi:hypothetical protein
MEFFAVTPDGMESLAQPQVVGQRGRKAKLGEALKKLDMKPPTDLGGIAATGRWGTNMCF